MLRFSLSLNSSISTIDLQVAIVNYMVAKRLNEEFIVRVEDINEEDRVSGQEEESLLILEKFALIHDKKINQSDNIHIHQSLAIKLLKEKKAFVCTCSTEEDIYDCKCLNTDIDADTLKKDKVPFVVRVNKSTDNNSFIILNEKGMPTQLFASTCDDILSNIEFIMQSEKSSLNIEKERYIKSILDYDSSLRNYAIIPIIENEMSIKSLFEKGYIPDAIANYLILLVLDKDEDEIFTIPQVIESGYFKIYKMARYPIWFNLDNLGFINGEHLKMMEDKKLSSLFGFSDIDIGKLAKLYIDYDKKTINELDDKIKMIFAPKDFSGEYGKEMRFISEIIANAPMINDFDEFINYIESESKLIGDDLLNPLKYLLTGEDDIVELSKIYPYIKSYILEVAS